MFKFLNLSKAYFISLLLLNTMACRGVLDPTEEHSHAKSQKEQLIAAIKINHFDKVRRLCQEDPKLGLLEEDAKPILLMAIKYSKAASYELVKHCEQAIRLRDFEGNSLLMMAIKEAGYSSPNFDDSLLKLVELSSSSVLLQPNKSGITALHLAESYYRPVLKLAIKNKLKQAFGPNDKYVPPTFFDNKYASVIKIGEEIKFTIKLSITEPLFVRDDGTIIDNLDVNTISYKAFANIAYILLAKNHWFAQLFLNNPFANASPPFLIPRASIWGKALAVLKEEQNSVLFGVNAVLPDLLEVPTLTATDMAEWFPDFQKNIIGQGGVGKIYSFSYNGKQYALKQNASEAGSLEKLQFTDAVIKIYGIFKFNKEQYLIMKKGIESLDDMIKRKESLNDKELLSFLPQVLFLLEAEKKLRINSSDIKPQNLLLTDEGLKVIDITNGYTPGYSGTEGAKFVQSLLAANLSKSFKYGYVDLYKYFEFNHKDRKNIASDEIFKFWLEKICIDKKLATNCSTIKTFDDLYSKFSSDKIAKLVLKRNQAAQQLGITFFDSGTEDFLYGTNLPLPQLLSPAQVNWQAYFDEKNKIIAEFCKKIKETYTPYVNAFFIDLRAKYDAQCDKAPGGQYLLEILFTDKNNTAFRQWIYDAFVPQVKLNSFITLAFGVNWEELFEYIIESEYSAKPDIKKLMLEILHFK